MDRLCDEVLQLIFDELAYPGDLVLVSKRFHEFSQDPYVRAHYFMERYGSTQALYQALGRGKVLTERVLDILMSSGAHFSRYLVQVAFHHYFHTRTHFIKTTWVRNVPLSVFTYFLKLAADAYGDIPRGKMEDDGALFTWFLQESRYAETTKRVTWETVRDLLEKYNFIPFSSKDPLMAQFPLALALEPRLLPYAVANGFYMDSKYRNFIFRKMFERLPDKTADTIASNVRELSRLDSSMFVSRTVGAEVCMEPKYNTHGYNALKCLSLSKDLVFDLGALVQDLLKLFYKTRSVTQKPTQDVLRHLWKDFPSSDPTVRLVMLLTVFLPGDNSVNMTKVRERLAELKLGEVTKADMRNLMINPFMDHFSGLVDYMRKEVVSDVTHEKGLTSDEVLALVEEVSCRCLEIGCKGRTLKNLREAFPTIREAIKRTVCEVHEVRIDELPDLSAKDIKYRLCRPWYRGHDDSDYFWQAPSQGDSDGVDYLLKVPSREFLGPIGQESLSMVIRQEENIPSRSRRRIFLDTTPSSATLYNIQPDLYVGKWIKNEFGSRSSITATFLTHAIINDDSVALEEYLSISRPASERVPLTFKHFQIMAALQQAPSYILFRYISKGGEFYMDEYAYTSQSVSTSNLDIKTESAQAPKLSKSISPSRISSTRTRKRPRRSAASTVQSYAVPGSDEEAMIVDEFDGSCGDDEQKAQSVDVHLRLWIKHLGDLLKVEHAKHLEIKRRLTQEAGLGSKVRVFKNEFFKSLAMNLRMLRKLDEEKRQEVECASAESSDGDDEDYIHTGKAKRRKTAL